MRRRALRTLGVLLALGLLGLGCSSSDDGTGPEPETPTVLSVDPADGAIHVDRDTAIAVRFSVAMDETSVENATSLSDPTLGLVSYSTEWLGNLFVLHPDASLDAEVDYTLVIGTDAESAAGVALAEAFSSSFTTLPDHPVVLETLPGDGATGVGTNSAVSILFSQGMDQSSTEAALSVDPSIAYSVSWPESYRLQMDFLTDLDPSTTYTITVGASAEAEGGGSSLGTDYAFSFTTGTGIDNTPPSITSYSPANGATNVSVDVGEVVLTFSEPIQGLDDIDALDVRLYLAALGNPELSPDGMTWTVHLARLPAGSTLSVDFGPILDLAGNSYDPPEYSFTTGGTPEFYPASLGDFWTYGVVDDGGEYFERISVDAVTGNSFTKGIYSESFADREFDQLEEVDNYTRTSTSLYWTSWTEYYDLDSQTWDPEPDIEWLHFPIQMGQSWNGQTFATIETALGRITYEAEVTAIEDVLSPFGLSASKDNRAWDSRQGGFVYPDCAKVELSYTLEASDGEGGWLVFLSGTEVDHYCAGLGLVQSVTDDTEYNELGNPVGTHHEESYLTPEANVAH